MKDLSGLMKQAQGMQAKLQDAQAKLAETTVDGVAGAGLVTLSLKGSGELTAVKIGEDVFRDGDAETLADLILAAHADAKSKLDAASQTLMQQAMGPLAGLAGGIPGLKFLAVRRIGLIGGMSWESTLEYYRLINRGVKAALGGHHSAPCIVYSVDFADIERRQREGLWDEMGEALAEAALALEGAGAEAVMLCTNTMHKAAPRMVRDLTVPFLHIADATADAVRGAGLETVGLLGTRHTMEQAFLKDRLTGAGLRVLTPDPQTFETLNGIIFQELCLGRIEAESREAFKAVIADLTAAGAEGVILGCTEIGLLIGEDDVTTPLFDTTAIHAAAAVRFVLGAPAPVAALQPQTA